MSKKKDLIKVKEEGLYLKRRKMVRSHRIKDMERFLFNRFTGLQGACFVAVGFIK